MEWEAVGKGKELDGFYDATVLVNATCTAGSAYRRPSHPEASRTDSIDNGIQVANLRDSSEESGRGADQDLDLALDLAVGGVNSVNGRSKAVYFRYISIIYIYIIWRVYMHTYGCCCSEN